MIAVYFHRLWWLARIPGSYEIDVTPQLCIENQFPRKRYRAGSLSGLTISSAAADEIVNPKAFWEPRSGDCHISVYLSGSRRSVPALHLSGHLEISILWPNSRA